MALLSCTRGYLLSQNRSAIPTSRHGVKPISATALSITPSNRSTTITSITPVAPYLGILNLGIRSSPALHFGHSIFAANFFNSENDALRGSNRACNGCTSNPQLQAGHRNIPA